MLHAVSTVLLEIRMNLMVSKARPVIPHRRFREHNLIELLSLRQRNVSHLLLDAFVRRLLRISDFEQSAERRMIDFVCVDERMGIGAGWKKIVTHFHCLLKMNPSGESLTQ